MTKLLNKTILRAIAKNKLFFVIKVIGLSIALAASLLILLFCFSEFGYDGFHKNKDNLYRVVCKIYENGEIISESATIPAPVGTIVFDKIPEIANFSNISIPYKDDVYRYKETIINEYGCLADTAFLRIFSIPIIHGDRGKLKPNSLLISDKIAKKYFGNENPVGKTLNEIRCSNGRPYVIAGVFKMPGRTHLNLEIIYSDDEFPDPNWRNNWNQFRHTYIFLKPNSNVKEVERKISQVVNDNHAEELKKQNIRYDFGLQKVEDIYLHSNLKNEAKPNGDINLVNALLLLAFVIIIIAWINYMNLTVAQSMEKAKETGIRLVFGASRTEICFTTLFESVFTGIIALALAIIVTVIAIPYFNQFVEKNILNGIPASFWIVSIGIFFIGTIVSGLYPAIILTTLKNSDIIQSKFKYSRKGIISRKVFLGIQFSASIAAIIITLFVYKQINYMKAYNKGFNSEQVICISDNIAAKENTNTTGFAADLLKYPQFLYVSKVSSLPGNEVYHKGIIKRSLSDSTFNKIFEMIFADENYIDVFQFKMVAGRKFSTLYPTDKQGVILNEEAVKYLGFDSPENAINNEVLKYGEKFKIIGVIQNFNQLPLNNHIQPLVYFNRGQGPYAIRLKTADIKEGLKIIEKTYKRYFDGAFKYYFVDDYYNQQYKNEIKFSQLFLFFSIILICIASFGLFGLAMYMAYQRRKEVALHLVNGAKRWQILLLITKDYIILILISFCIVSLFAYDILNKWLEKFAYRIELSLWMFALAGITALVIALASVSWQAWRAANKNPVEALRNE